MCVRVDDCDIVPMPSDTSDNEAISYDCEESRCTNCFVRFFAARKACGFLRPLVFLRLGMS